MVTLQIVFDFINEKFDVDISSSGKKEPLSKYRKFYYALVEEFVNENVRGKDIGGLVNRDHSILINQLKAFKNITAVDKKFLAEYEELKNAFKIYIDKNSLIYHAEATKLYNNFTSNCQYDSNLIIGIAYELIKLVIFKNK